MGQTFSLLYSRPAEKTSSSIDHLSDKEVDALIWAARDEDALGFWKSDPESFMEKDSIVDPISYDAVYKEMRETEIFMMTYVANHTSIPIPRIRRILRRPNCWPFDIASVVIDRIDGEPLLTVWPKLSWWARLRIIFTIRDYVRQLHSMPVPYPGKPGPFDGHDRRHICRGGFFTMNGGGPFDSYTELADWYDQRRYEAMVLHHQYTGTILGCPKFDRSVPLVFCHGDLCMQNIVIDRNGVPWMIDFGESGVLPVWFDYMKAALRFQPGMRADFVPPWWWQWATPFIFGGYGKYLYDYIWPMSDTGVLGCDPDDMKGIPADYFSKLGIDID